MKPKNPESTAILKTLKKLRPVVKIAEVGRMSEVDILNRMRAKSGINLAAPERERIKEALNQITKTLISAGFTGGYSITTEDDAVYSKA